MKQKAAFNPSVKRKLYGSDFKMDIAVIFIYLAGGAIYTGSLFLLLDEYKSGVLISNDILGYSMESIFILVALIILVTNTVLMVRRQAHKAELKVKFQELSEDEQIELLEMASNYEGRWVSYNDKYIYGKMARVFNYSLPGDLIDFEYIAYEDIERIDSYKSKNQENRDSRRRKTTQSVLLGATMAYRRVQNPYPMHGDKAVLERIDNQPFSPDNFICIELTNGEKYRAFGQCDDIEKLEPLVKAVNKYAVVGSLKD